MGGSGGPWKHFVFQFVLESKPNNKHKTNNKDNIMDL
jgi:hypothetical protein